MEEGGGELEHRINVWKESGRPNLLDTNVMHVNMPNVNGLYTGNYAQEIDQKTISPLIKSILVPFFQYQTSPNQDAGRLFQATHLGRLCTPPRHALFYKGFG
jgi:hypothetical protein